MLKMEYALCFLGKLPESFIARFQVEGPLLDWFMACASSLLSDSQESKESREAQPQALDQKNREKGAESETRRKNRRERKNGTTWHNSEETLFKSSELPCPSLLHIPTGHLLRNSHEHCKVRVTTLAPLISVFPWQKPFCNVAASC